MQYEPHSARPETMHLPAHWTRYAIRKENTRTHAHLQCAPAFPYRSQSKGDNTENRRAQKYCKTVKPGLNELRADQQRIANSEPAPYVLRS